MLKKSKIISLLLCFCLLFEQTGFAQVAGTLDISGHLAAFRNSFIQDKFRPLHLRSLGYDNNQNNFRLLLDKGDLKNPKKPDLEIMTKTLLNYFFVGVTLPNDAFWVNLRPDSENNIIDPDLATTDVGKILLEADLQLKKDTAKFTSPETPEGKEYWEKLYQKAGELLGYENVTIPTLTRPWIVPGEIIIRETKDNAYIYKATLKVMLEQDYLKDSATYNFDDPRLKTLNEYSSQLIRDLIIPKLTKEVNTSQRYAPLRQVYYSLILAQWFKARFYGKGGLYSWLIDRRGLQGLTSKISWSKTTYFKAYQKSFKDGEYNIQQPVYTPYGQTIRSYFSGGFICNVPMPVTPPTPGVAIEITEGPTKVTAISGDSKHSPLPRTENIVGALAVGGNTMDPSETKVTITREASSPSGLPAGGLQSGASSVSPTATSNEKSQAAAKQASLPNLGAQVSDVKHLDRLLWLLNVLRRSENVLEVPGNASDRDIIEFCIKYLQAKGLITTTTDDDSNVIITINNNALNHPDETLRRFVEAIQRWVINPEGGVRAVNFQGKDGVWMIVGFESELQNKDTLEHEQQEIKFRKQGLSWTEAHNQAVAETGKGQRINREEAAKRRAGRQDEIGAMQGNGEELDLAQFLTFLHTRSGGNADNIKGALNQGQLSGSLQGVGRAQYEIFKSKIKKVREHQFSGMNRPIVEIVANAIDAYREETEGVIKDVTVNTHEHGFEISDTGKGMSFEQVILDLLIPSRSPKRDKPGKTIGRFGVGFYSVLNYLHNAGDQLIVETSNGRENTRVAFWVVRENNEDVVKIKIEEPKDVSITKGTTVKLYLERGNFDIEAHSQILKSYLRFNPYARIFVNGECINSDFTAPAGRYNKIYNNGCTVYYSEVRSSIGEGRIFVIIDGVVISTLTVKGIDIPEETIVVFPPQTTLTKARDRIICQQKEREYIFALIDTLAQDPQNIRILNVLYSLVTALQKQNTEPQKNIITYYIDALSNLIQRSGLRVLPDVENMDKVRTSQNVVFINADVFPKVKRFLPGLERFTSHESSYEIYVAEFDDNEVIFAHSQQIIILNKKYIPNTDEERGALELLFELNNLSVTFKREKESQLSDVTKEELSHPTVKQGLIGWIRTYFNREKKMPMGAVRGADLFEYLLDYFYEKTMHSRMGEEIGETVDIERVKQKIRNLIDGKQDLAEEALRIARKYFGTTNQRVKPQFVYNFYKFLCGDESYNYNRDLRSILGPASRKYRDMCEKQEFREDMLLMFLLASLQSSVIKSITGDPNLLTRVNNLVSVLKKYKFREDGFERALGYFLAIADQLEKEGLCTRSDFLEGITKLLDQFPLKDIGIFLEAFSRQTYQKKEPKKETWRLTHKSKNMEFIKNLERFLLPPEIFTPIEIIYGVPFSESLDKDNKSYSDLYLRILTLSDRILSQKNLSSEVKQLYETILQNKFLAYSQGDIEIDELLEFLNLFSAIIIEEGLKDASRIRKLADDLGIIVKLLKDNADKNADNKPVFVKASQLIRKGYTLELIDLFAQHQEVKYIFDFLQIFDASNKRFNNISPQKALILWKALIEKDKIPVNGRRSERTQDNIDIKDYFSKVILYGNPQTEYEAIVQALAEIADTEGKASVDKLARPYLFFLESDELSLQDITLVPKRVLSDRMFKSPYRFNLAVLVALCLSGDLKDVTPAQLLELIGLGGQEGLITSLCLSTARDSLRESINFESADQYIFIRELMQNSLDARSRFLDINAFLTANGITLTFTDEVGMTLEEVIKFLLIPDSSTKRNNKEFIGKFGQGFFTALREAKEVYVKTSDGSDKIILIKLTPRRQGELIVDVDVTFEVIENKEQFKGTIVEWTKETETPELEAAILKSKAITYGGLVSPDEFKIRWGGVSGQVINKGKELFGSFQTEYGVLRVYYSQEKENAITHRGLFVRDIDRDIWQLLPDYLRKIAEAKGLIIDLPAGVELISDRSDITNRHAVLMALQKPLVICVIKGIMDLFAKGKIDLDLLPYDILDDQRYWERIPERISDDAKRLSNNQDIDLTYYMDNNRALAQLMLSIPFIEIGGKNLSLAEVLKGLIRGKIKISQLPTKIGEFLKERLAIRERKPAATSKDENKEEKVFHPLYDTYLDFSHREASFDTYWAFLELMKKISELLFEKRGDAKKVLMAYYASADWSSAKCIRGTTRIAWNLLLNEELLEKFSLYLKGELSFEDIRQIFYSMFETQLHELVHTIEGTGEWTHDATFHALHRELSQLLVKNFAEVEKIFEQIKRQYKGTFVSVNDFIAYLNNSGIKGTEKTDVGDNGENSKGSSPIDRGFEGDVGEVDAKAFAEAWRNGRNVEISQEHLDVLQDTSMWPTFKAPQVRLVSRQAMDGVAQGANVVRLGNQVLVVGTYWNSLSEDEKLDVLMHEGMADWLERERSGMPAEDTAIDLKGLKRNEAERRAEHLVDTSEPAKAQTPSGQVDKKGGIDFRALPVVNQQINMGMLKLSAADLNRLGNINLDSEWAQIQNMVNAGIIPSNERIKEYVLASCLRENLGNRMDKVLGCIADIMRMEEDRVTDADTELKDMLVLIEAGKPETELQCGLSQIKISPQEPQLITP